MPSILNYFILGALGGLLAWPCSIFTGFNSKNRVDNWIRFFFTVGKYSAPKQILNRAQFLAKPPLILSMFGYAPAFLGFGFSFLPLLFWGNPASLVMLFAVYTMLSGAALEKGFPANYDFSLEVLNRIAVTIANSFPSSKSEDLFKYWLKSKHPNVREAAGIGISNLEKQIALPLLQKMVNDPDPNVQFIAYRLLLKVKGIQVEDDSPLFHDGPIVHDKSKDNDPDTPKSTPGDWFRAQGKEHQIVEFAPRAQTKTQHWTIKNAFPNLYCRECRCFAEKITNGVFSLFRCPNCKLDLYLTYGFDKIIGQIGGDFDFVLLDDLIKVQAWDPELQKTTTAEFHTLEIIGGKDIDYDWAINAVVEQLHRMPKRFYDLEVVFTDSPVLSENSKRILEAFLAENKKRK